MKSNMQIARLFISSFMALATIGILGYSIISSSGIFKGVVSLNMLYVCRILAFLAIGGIAMIWYSVNEFLINTVLGDTDDYDNYINNTDD